jgi:hypothetical protein
MATLEEECRRVLAEDEDADASTVWQEVVTVLPWAELAAVRAVVKRERNEKRG